MICVSIIVLAYNNEASIIEVLECAREASVKGVNQEIIAVDS